MPRERLPVDCAPCKSTTILNFVSAQALSDLKERRWLRAPASVANESAVPTPGSPPNGCRSPPQAAFPVRQATPRTVHWRHEPLHAQTRTHAAANTTGETVRAAE